MSTITKLKAEIRRAKFVTSIMEREFDTNQTLKVLSANLPIFWSWGVSKRVNYYNKALMLQVNGRYHKGKVWITLAWDDTYTVYIATNQNKILQEYKMVYFDMLVDVIDGYIETRK